MRTTLNLDDGAMQARPFVRVLVDSSAWMEFLNGNPSRTAEKVSKLLLEASLLS